MFQWSKGTPMNTPFEEIERERLPTLYEVLIQRTSTPVDLWTFYTYLSQYPYAINYLDFWIDLMAHTRLCKDYVLMVRQSLIEEGEGHEDIQSVTTSVLMNTLMEGEDASRTPTSGGDGPNKVSKILEEWRRSNGNEMDISNGNLSHLMDDFLESREQTGKPYLSTRQLLKNAMHLVRTYIESDSKSDRYLTNIPESLRQELIRDVLHDGKYDPELFHELKDIIYQFLEIDCFPKFLSQVALHNLHDEISNWRFHKIARDNINSDTEYQYNGGHTPFSNYTVLSRIIFGLCWLGIGFWIGYTLIFLNYSRAIRVVTVVPFAVGMYYVVCGLYQVDIIYTWFGVTQRIMYGEMKERQDIVLKDADKIPWILCVFGGRHRLLRIQHAFINRLLLRRGLWCTLIVAAATACLTVIFSCVPGKRL